MKTVAASNDPYERYNETYILIANSKSEASELIGLFSTACLRIEMIERIIARVGASGRHNHSGTCYYKILIKLLERRDLVKTLIEKKRYVLVEKDFTKHTMFLGSDL